ncbi:hypothetical protein QJS10_CPB12g01112 [Acorus calamus]|uniref:Uncharacterized protein n=1 Tax=Acorus calamus TaxID=4465 RepID=A0AAV9DP20_ACOCL|nr:hypothetical protein QJS10_CPB12g01112 [Acorus calamus]
MQRTRSALSATNQHWEFSTQLMRSEKGWQRKNRSIIVCEAGSQKEMQRNLNVRFMEHLYVNLLNVLPCCIKPSECIALH